MDDSSEREEDDDGSVIGTLHMEVTDEDWDPLQYARIGRPKSPPVRPNAAPASGAPPTATPTSVDKKFGVWHKKPQERRRRRRRRRRQPLPPEEEAAAPPTMGRRRKQLDGGPEVPALEPRTNRRRLPTSPTTSDPPSPAGPMAVRRPERTYARRRQAPRLLPPQCGALAEAGPGPTLAASEERHSLAFCFPPPHTFDFEAEQALVQLSLNAETAKEQALQRTKYRRAYRYRLMHPTPDATQCEHCGGFYNTRPNFHMYSCPALHRKVPCPDCGRVFATSRTLRSHQVIHTRSVMKTHPCLLCGKLYASKKGVSRHMSDMHQDVMKHRHQCTICHRRFSEESGLLKHVKVHEGREPLRCPGCDKHFTYPSNMKYHKCRGRSS